MSKKNISSTAAGQSGTVSQQEKENTTAAAEMGRHLQASVSRMSRSPGAKFIMTGVITVLLMIPALLVWGLVEERADRAENVARDISRGWGDTQIINGPYLAIPYKVFEKTGKVSLEGVQMTREVVRHALVSAENIAMDSGIEVEERKKSIYSTPLYHVKSTIRGRFDRPDLKPVLATGGVPDYDNAFLVMGVSDTAGFRSGVMLKIDNKNPQPFQPGLRRLSNYANPDIASTNRHATPASSIQNGGINIGLDAAQIRQGFDFEIDMALNGSRSLAVVPGAKNTALKITSNWPHPGFVGRFLPESRKITDEGFSAEWTIPDLARGIDSVWLSSTLPQAGSYMQVNFVEPLKFYQVVSRTLKYSIAFFSLIFLSVFILELMGKKPVHWIQYVLVGLAMVVFYILLLALAEHVGFNIAYFVSAFATTSLIAWYIGDSLGQKNSMAIMAGVLGTLYTIVFLVLKEQEYALLAGSIIAFLAIATTMVVTRKVDWSGKASRSGEASTA